MSSYNEILASIDQDVLATVDSSLIDKLVYLFRNELVIHGATIRKTAVRILDEWCAKNQKRNITYTIGLDEGTIRIVDEYGAGWQKTTGRLWNHREDESFREHLASIGLLYIKRAV